MRATASSSAKTAAVRPATVATTGRAAAGGLSAARPGSANTALKSGPAKAGAGGAGSSALVAGENSRLGSSFVGGSGAGGALSMSQLMGSSTAAGGLNAAVANSIVAALASFGIHQPLSAQLKAIFANVESVFGGSNCDVVLKPQGKKVGTRAMTDGEKAIAQRLEDAQKALKTVLTRRDEAFKAADGFEQDLAVKLEAASKLQQELAEVTSAKTAAEKKIAGLTAELKAAKEAEANARQREKEADEELDNAQMYVDQKTQEIEGLKAQLEETEQALEDAKALNEGLESDKEELKDKLKTITQELEKLKEEHKREVEMLSGSAKEGLASASAKINSLQFELSVLQEEHESAQQNVAELEKKLGVSQLDVLRLQGERDNAMQAKRDAEMMLEATRREAESSRTSTASMFEQFNKQTQLHHTKEMELGKTITEKTAKVEELQSVVLALKTAEAGLQGDLRETRSNLERATSELEETKKSLAAAQSELSSLKLEQAALKTSFADLQAKHEKAVSAAIAAENDLREQLTVSQNRLLEATERLALAETAAAEWRAKERLWKETEERYLAAKTAAEESIDKLKLELSTVKANAGSTTESTIAKLTEQVLVNEDLKKSVKNMVQLKKKLAESEALVAKLQEEVLQGELARRALHNTVQELKGNIRVFVRVRPFLPNDFNNSSSSEEVPSASSAFTAVLPGTGETVPSAVQVSPDGTSISIVPPPPRGTKEGFTKRETKPTAFTFDNVFSSKAGQQDVFDEVSHLVQSALDGYQVCLFAYGQTGAGKSFTMVGDNSKPASSSSSSSLSSSGYFPSDSDDASSAVVAVNPNAGMIPRSVKLIIDTARKMETQGWKYSLEVSFLEIYNETLRDLLVGGNSKGSSSSSSSSSSSEGADSLGIHQDVDGNPEVPGLTKVAVSDASTIDALLAQADKRRSVACTNMNERSSRSHQVFSLYIRGVHQGKGIAVNGTLNLCDLAGSERLSRSGAEGDRKKEAAAINKSLSCLADVFTALAKKSPHVPFRNSKLTHLLQRCFKGDGKTLMLVNLSPTLESAFESLCSLRFASQVSQVEMGKPVKKVVEMLAPAPVSASAAGGAGAGAMACDGGANAGGGEDEEGESGLNASSMDSSFAAEEDNEEEDDDGEEEAAAAVTGASSKPSSITAAPAVGSKRPASSALPSSSSAAAASAGVAAKRPATASTIGTGATSTSTTSSKPGAASSASAAGGLKKAAGASRNLTAPTAASSGRTTTMTARR